jgi:hypothetical protein
MKNLFFAGSSRNRLNHGADLAMLREAKDGIIFFTTT